MIQRQTSLIPASKPKMSINTNQTVAKQHDKNRRYDEKFFRTELQNNNDQLQQKAKREEIFDTWMHQDTGLLPELGKLSYREKDRGSISRLQPPPNRGKILKK